MEQREKGTEMATAAQSYYDSSGENEWKRLESAPGRLEFAVNAAIIETYLAPASKVLDLGGGPGRYSIFLAQKGHTVWLADLSPALLRIAKAKIAAAGVAAQIVGIDVVDARDLSPYPDEQFDAVLALGPFYHLVRKADRDKAALELRRVTKPGGVIFVAAHSVYGWLNGLIERAHRDPAQVPVGTFEQVLHEQIYFNPTPQGFTEGYFFQPKELETLFVQAGFAVLQLLSSKGFAFGQETALLQLQDKCPRLYQEIFTLVLATASDPELIASSGQMLLVGKRQ
jgi:ubiquinone/menaquinone biosynthesis C-methylase UbiE